MKREIVVEEVNGRYYAYFKDNPVWNYGAKSPATAVGLLVTERWEEIGVDIIYK